jgi:pyrimidine dimer DNA glycosylase
MQTFLPVADFTDSARLLDSPRLGKQRVETLQILRAIELPDYGWANHPAVLMWRGRTPALVAYGLAMARVWRERGFADTTERQIGEFAPEVVGRSQDDLAAAGLLPSWLGDEELHRSHRSNLIAKDPAFYRSRFAERFGTEPDDLPYVWPGPDDVAPVLPPEGSSVWVVRPRNHNELGACLAAGVVGLGTQSGIDVDATGLSPAELRVLSKELSGRRPAKDLRQLSAFLDDVAAGDRVALPIEHGTGLLLGEVVGDYLFQGRELLPHRRPARWDRVVPRSAARPPATLQDPRALFRVVLDPVALT